MLYREKVLSSWYLCVNCFNWLSFSHVVLSGKLTVIQRKSCNVVLQGLVRIYFELKRMGTKNSFLFFLFSLEIRWILGAFYEIFWTSGHANRFLPIQLRWKSRGWFYELKEKNASDTRSQMILEGNGGWLVEVAIGHCASVQFKAR